jgi:predicted RNA-binding protein YlqC (UPF0109 family)
VNELLLYLARQLVANPDEVSVTEVETAEGTVLELRVADGDVGRVIGRGGRTARALRTVVRAAAVREGRRANVEIVSA